MMQLYYLIFVCKSNSAQLFNFNYLIIDNYSPMIPSHALQHDILICDACNNWFNV